MEVHHHPDLHHKKKNFKEYLLTSINNKYPFFEMNEKTKQRFIKMLFYILIGFAVAYFWHRMKE